MFLGQPHCSDLPCHVSLGKQYNPPGVGVLDSSTGGDVNTFSWQPQPCANDVSATNVSTLSWQKEHTYTAQPTPSLQINI